MSRQWGSLLTALCGALCLETKGIWEIVAPSLIYHTKLKEPFGVKNGAQNPTWQTGQAPVAYAETK